MRPHFKNRYRLFIYPSFQLRLLGVQLGVLLLGYGLAAVGIHQAFEELRSTALAAGIKSDHIYYRFLENQASSIYFFLTLALGLGAVIGSIVCLILSHKLAGPIVRLKSYFRNLAESEPGSIKQPIQFRRGDFFEDLPSLINRALEKISVHAKPENDHQKET